MKRLMLLLVGLGLMFNACRKDEPDLTPTPQPDEIEQISTSVFGLVQDQDGAAVSGASVRFGNLSTHTDDNGIFKLDKATVPSNWAYVQVEKAGFFKGSRTFIPVKDQRQFVKIQLLPRAVAGQFNSTTGGTVSLNEQVILDFGTNSIIDANGVQYVGEVTVEAAYIDPSAANLSTIMPGTLVGVDTDNTDRGLISYGMAAIELVGTAGQELNIAPGHEVSLTIEVPQSKIANAPATIPLWHFDETTGLWAEEGSAVLNGNQYTGKVSHFSFWNCDDPYTLITLSGAFTWESINPLAFFEVEITLLSTGEVGNGFTDTQGNLTAAVPMGEPMTLSLLDGCGTVFYSMPIGPFSANTDIGQVNITADDVSTAPFATITGQVTDCDNLPLSNGYLKVVIGNRTGFLTPDVNGVVNGILPTCGASSVDVEAVDLNNLTYSSTQSFTVDDMLDVGTIQACEEAFDEYILYIFDGQPYQIVDYVDMNDSLGIDMYLLGEGNGNSISMYSPTSGLGTHAVNWITVNGINTAQGGAPNMTITVTNYPTAVGELWEGSFEGTFTDQQSVLHEVSGTFKAIKDY